MYPIIFDTYMWATNTMLNYFIEQNDEEMIHLLIINGAAINLKTDKIESALVTAIKQKSINIIIKLLKFGAIVDLSHIKFIIRNWQHYGYCFELLLHSPNTQKEVKEFMENFSSNKETKEKIAYFENIKTCFNNYLRNCQEFRGYIKNEVNKHTSMIPEICSLVSDYYVDKHAQLDWFLKFKLKIK